MTSGERDRAFAVQLDFLREQLLAQAPLDQLDPFAIDEATRDQLRILLAELLAAQDAIERADDERIDALLAELVGLGPLDRLLSDPHVSDVLVNGPEEIWVERAGRLERTGEVFRSPAQLTGLMEKIAALVGRSLSLQTPVWTP